MDLIFTLPSYTLGSILDVDRDKGQDCVSGARAVYQGQADLVWGTYGYLASISPVHVLLPNI